jgi:rare lipoprotein A
LKSSLKKEVRVQVAQINGEKIYRLMVGEFNSKREAQVFKEKAAQLYPDCFIVELK